MSFPVSPTSCPRGRRCSPPPHSVSSAPQRRQATKTPPTACASTPTARAAPQPQPPPRSRAASCRAPRSRGRSTAPATFQPGRGSSTSRCHRRGPAPFADSCTRSFRQLPATPRSPATPPALHHPNSVRGVAKEGPSPISRQVSFPHFGQALGTDIAGSAAGCLLAGRLPAGRLPAGRLPAGPLPAAAVPRPCAALGAQRPVGCWAV
mmetsp:Transcript_21523/g.40190  ORF Transcript_21523/g.40190 Transcript_21523/m.40190 type:complete len:207 (+) Transcript_21523:559-1179(+)